MDAVLKVLNSYSVMIVIASVMIIAFARTIIKIFRMGATFKTEFASKQELQAFEVEMRRDMRGYATQIQKTCIDTVMTVINNKFKDVEDSKEAVVDVKVMKTEIEVEIKNALSRLDDMNQINDSVRALSAKVARLEQQGLEANGRTGERRHE